MNLQKEHIEVFRQYLLTHDEEIRLNLRSILPGKVLKYLSIVEDGFLRSYSIENIATNIEAIHLAPDLKELQIEYYTSLAEMYLHGQTNDAINSLLAHDNDLFNKILSSLSDVLTFETNEFIIKI